MRTTVILAVLLALTSTGLATAATDAVGNKEPVWVCVHGTGTYIDGCTCVVPNSGWWCVGDPPGATP